jgi:hypothetical protein
VRFHKEEEEEKEKEFAWRVNFRSLGWFRKPVFGLVI